MRSADLLPGPGDVERLINRLEKKDPHRIFKEPVTDAVVGLEATALFAAANSTILVFPST